MTRRDEILERVKSVPVLPASAVRIMELASDLDTPINELRIAIEFDPGLTSNVLRLANSAYYRGAGEISTIRDAVVRLGAKSIVQMVLASAIEPLARQPIRGYGLPAGALLDNAAAVAIAVEEFAQKLQIEAPPYAFTAGLLHDLGKIVMGTFLELDAGPILQLAFEEGLSFDMAEQRVLGVDHAEVGAVLLEGWNVPKAICETVRWHHEPGGYTQEDTRAVDLVHVADIAGRLAGFGVGSDGLNYAPSIRVLRRLRITTQITEEVVSQVLIEMKRLEPILDRTPGE